MVCLGQMRYCLVASRDSPLGQMKKVNIEALSRYRQIIFNSVKVQNYILNSQCWEVNDVFATLYWASLGIGWAAVPLGLARRVSRDESMRNLVILDMDTVALMTQNIYLISNNAFSRRDILEIFCKDLKDYYQVAFEQEADLF